MKASLLLIPLFFSACGKPTEVRKATPEETTEIARAAAQEAFQALSAELAKAMADGGPVSAIPVCSNKAGSIIQQVASKRKLEMIRLSDKPRNVAQQAQGTDLEAIEAFRNALKNGGVMKPQMESLADGSVVVRAPIVISAPLCLQCHGGESDIAPATRKAILGIYPADKATGYQLNDLRGIWRIKVPAGSTP
jgi:hypothetical protein